MWNKSIRDYMRRLWWVTPTILAVSGLAQWVLLGNWGFFAGSLLGFPLGWFIWRKD